MKRTFLIGSLLLVSPSLLGATPVAKIQAMLAKPKILCGRFDQTKKLAGIRKPLVSNGRFCAVADKGVLWRTLKPFHSTLRLTRDEIVQLQGERVTLHLDAKKEPVVRMIHSVLFASLTGDLGQIERLFEIDGSASTDRWSVRLKARAPSLARIIVNIALEGGVYIKQIALVEASGDHTTIVFSEIQVGDAAMTTDEAALF